MTYGHEHGYAPYDDMPLREEIAKIRAVLEDAGLLVPEFRPGASVRGTLDWQAKHDDFQARHARFMAAKEARNG